MTDEELNKAVYTLNKRMERLNNEIEQDAPKTIIDLEISLIQESLTIIAKLLENKSYNKK